MAGITGLEAEAHESQMQQEQDPFAKHRKQQAATDLSNI
jgi:hypothetical protein